MCARNCLRAVLLCERAIVVDLSRVCSFVVAFPSKYGFLPFMILLLAQRIKHQFAIKIS